MTTTDHLAIAADDARRIEEALKQLRQMASGDHYYSINVAVTAARTLIDAIDNAHRSREQSANSLLGNGRA